ncbi:MAG: ABC transporter ATP-binding protein [Truepera sp.]|jgi:simple sugar transport system ATP-binding protein|nr:ABC transporter ATP-binding protein [Truepera sp.]
MAHAVSMRGITKRFPLVIANQDVDFTVDWGEVHALVGENGAGKSTLMKILYGMQQPDAGTIQVNDKSVVIRSAREAIALGIGMVHQHFMLVEPLTVAENIVLGSEPRVGPVLDMRTATRRTEELIEEFGFDIAPDNRIEDLPVGLQQQVEILKALYRQARILILDEPTAVLTPQETVGLFRFLRDFASKGHAAVFISHKLDEVVEICDRMSVMRDGAMIGTVERANTDQRRLANMMVGRDVLLRVKKGPADPGTVALEVRNLVLKHVTKPRNVLDDVSFELRHGEILGIAGVEGNGQSELVEVITGLRLADSGTVLARSRQDPALQDITEHDVRQRHELGISHVPEDRTGRGLVMPFSASLNSILGDHYLAPYTGAVGLLRAGVIEDHARKLIKDYDVRPTDPNITVSHYSGGNAQKLIVARELERGPSVLVMAQPTRGVDIGAIEFIHQQIVAARDAGLPVLLVSADLNEIMSLSDRIIVMYEGRVMGEMSQAEATPEKLGLMMAGSLEQAGTAAPGVNRPGGSA